MGFESSQETFKLKYSGSTLVAPKRIHSIILTPCGSHVALATISWTDIVGNPKTITLRATATDSTTYTPAKPVAVGGRDVEIMYTDADATVAVGTSGSELVQPHTNLVCRATVT